MKKILSLAFLVLMFSSSLMVIGANPTVTATQMSGDLGITIDGKNDDWAGVDSATISLTAAVAGHTADNTYAGEVQVKWNTTHFATLITITDDYDYECHSGVCTDNVNGTHKKSPALGVLFVINATGNAEDAVFMGGTGDYANETSVGAVDIWHWELDHHFNTVAGGYDNLDADNGGNDPNGNLDDEYATHSGNREDDIAENNLRGAYGHSGSGAGEFGPANGTAGDWYWEIIRPLTNDDVNDVQFKAGKTFYMNIAYWDADEKGEHAGWTDEGHFVSQTAIEIVLDAPASGTSGFEALAVVFGLAVPVIVIKRRK